MTKNITYDELFNQYERKFLNDNRRQLIEDVDKIEYELWKLKGRLYNSKKDARYKLYDFRNKLSEISEKCEELSNKWALMNLDYRDEHIPEEIMKTYRRLCSPYDLSIGENLFEIADNNQSKLFY